MSPESVMYRHCQSCGMPMARDAMHGGSESDGRRSTKYCSHCYADGRFTAPDLDVEQMRARVVDKLREFHFPRFFANWMTRGLPRLERWRDTG